MFNFFANEDCRQGNCYNISGGDFNHIINVLRIIDFVNGILVKIDRFVEIYKRVFVLLDKTW